MSPQDPAGPRSQDASSTNHAIAFSQDWLSRLAHDLRSPLVAIGYAAQMLRSGRAPPQKTEELFATIERQTAQLGRLAEEIGDMLLIGRDRFSVRQGACDLVAIVREALHDSTPGSVDIAIFQGGNAIGVHGDRGRLVQLLRHVIRLTGRRKPGTPLPVVGVSVAAGVAHVRIEDSTGAIYRSDALLYLADDAQPEDPGVLSMSDVIARRVLLAHGASLSLGPCVDERIGDLTLALPLPDPAD